MPREIDCPECGGMGIIKTMSIHCYAGDHTEIIDEEDCYDCDGLGKITVYTEAEYNKLREALKFIFGTAETIEDAEQVAQKALS